MVVLSFEWRQTKNDQCSAMAAKGQCQIRAFFCCSRVRRVLHRLKDILFINMQWEVHSATKSGLSFQVRQLETRLTALEQQSKKDQEEIATLKKTVKELQEQCNVAKVADEKEEGYHKA